MTVGGIGGQKLHVGAVCSCCHRRDWSGRWAKRFSSGESSHFYDCLKLCVNVGTTRSFGGRSLRLFLHMEERGNISDTCTCDDARARTHIESLNTQTHFLAHTWRSPCRIALRTHCQRTYYAHRSALCTHTHARTCTQARPSRSPRHSSGPTSTLAPGAGREARSERPTYRRCSTSRGSRLSPPSLAGQRTRTPV